MHAASQADEDEFLDKLSSDDCQPLAAGSGSLSRDNQRHYPVFTPGLSPQSRVQLSFPRAQDLT
jgi:hypothetical protein